MDLRSSHRRYMVLCVECTLTALLCDEGDRRAPTFNGCDFRHAARSRAAVAVRLRDSCCPVVQLTQDNTIPRPSDRADRQLPVDGPNSWRPGSQSLAVVRELRRCGARSGQRHTGHAMKAQPARPAREVTECSRERAGGKRRRNDVPPSGSGKQAGSTAQRVNFCQTPNRQFDR